MERLYEFGFLFGTAFLALAFFVLRGLTRNVWIRKRLQVSMFLLAGAMVIEIVALYVVWGDLNLDQMRLLEAVQLLLLGLAIVTAVVVLLFNRFREGSVSKKYPAIVQDAFIIGVFLLVIAYNAPDKLLTTSAVGALVIGLALQDTLGNLFSGLALQIEKPFSVGDWIHLADKEGRVTEVTWRATTVRTKSGFHVIIPNNVISKGTVVNYTSPSRVMRLEKIVGFPYEIQPNRIKELVDETCHDIPEILREPSPEALLEKYNDFSIDYRCRFWIKDFGESEPIMDSFTTRIFYHMKRAGIWIPFPIRDVRLTEASHAEAVAEADLKRRVAFVNSMDLFVSLPADRKVQIAECLERTLFAAGENIIGQGESGDSMFFISSGEVRVIVERHGAMERVAVMKSGDYFGEMSLLTGERRTATVQAATDVRAHVLRKESFGPVLQESPDIAEAISRTVADRKAELELKTAQMIASPRQKEVLRQSLLGRIQDFFGI